MTDSMYLTDIHMDEQQSLPVTVYVKKQSDSSPLDLTAGTNNVWLPTITWVASKDGTQLVKKDTPTMTIMLGPLTTTTLATPAGQQNTSGQNVIHVAQVAGFGRDGWGRPVADFAAGDYVNIIDSAGSESNIIETINASADTITMVNPLQNTYTVAHSASVGVFVDNFAFTLLPGDTMLPGTKSYGVEMVYDMLAIATWPGFMSPGNIYAEPSSLTIMRGRLFIDPILDMS